MKIASKELKDLESDNLPKSYDGLDHTSPRQPVHQEKEPSSRVTHNHFNKNILGDLDEGMIMRRRTLNQVSLACYLP